MNQVRILLTVLIVGTLSSCARAQTSEADAPASRTEVVRTLNAGRHQAIVRIAISALDPTDRLLSLSHTDADNDYRPLNAISEVSIQVDGQAIFVPHSAVLDVFDPHDLQLSATPNGYLLEIVGGDASEAYQAKIWFDETRILRREILAFDEVSESTQYNLIVVE